MGRAFGFSYGDKENGAFFNHMIVMLAFSLYKEGFVKEGRRDGGLVDSPITPRYDDVYFAGIKWLNSF